MSSLTRPISPPPRKRPRSSPSPTPAAKKSHISFPGTTSSVPTASISSSRSDGIEVISSPTHLYTVKDLPSSENTDCISLHDILHPQSTLTDLWSFNFMHNLPWLRSHLSREHENRIKISIVHGYWRQDDESRKDMERDVWGEKVKLIAAWLQDPYGTHHSKILVLFRSDGTAQIVVHTANMIPFDHENMTNAVYMTPHLPLKKDNTCPKTQFEESILEYFSYYSPSRTGELVSRLKKYDFSSVKAHFVASVPGKFENGVTKWGLSRLQHILKSTPASSQTELFAQFSSIGSFGKNDTWLKPHFHKTLSLSDTLSTSPGAQPPLRLIYPTLKNVQESLNGYRSGTSIHWTVSSAAHEAQERYMRPLLRQWTAMEAGRERAAPHIKTYGRVTHNPTNNNNNSKTSTRDGDMGGAGRWSFDWFLITSANLSKAAWGAPETGGLRIRSYEAGVLLSPSLYGDDTVLVPVWRSNTPSEEQVKWAKEKGYKRIVGVRMAWDLPFTKYGEGDVPWVRNRGYEGSDWLGMEWRH